MTHVHVFGLCVVQNFVSFLLQRHLSGEEPASLCSEVSEFSAGKAEDN